MKIRGFQKMTLIDYPGKIACTIFLFGCNFRCGFCHNPGLIFDDGSEDYREDKILDFLDYRKNYLEGVCISGGEPLLSLDKEFLKKIKEKGYLIKIDTNGSCPEKLKELIDGSLVDYVAMDIKTTKEKYKKIIGVDVDLDKIEQSIRLVSSLPEYEFRTTIIECLHSKKDILEMCEWLKKIVGGKFKRFSLQGFKKEAELLNNRFKNEKNTGREYLEELKKKIVYYCEEINIKV